jgi:putative membrane protein
MMNSWNTMNAGGWVLMSLLWLAFLALIVWAAVRLFPTGDKSQRDAEAPKDILDRRLARGEIDVETYERLRATVDKRAPAGR